jgi:hypothetical protein
MSLSNLSDGNPLTYDWLNSLVASINKASEDVKSVTGSSKINMIADHMASTAYVQILTGETVVNLAGKESIDKTLVTFSTPFASSDVLVIPAINFRNNAEEVYATAWVTNINESGCTIRVKRFAPIDKKKSTPITINYLAIGKGKKV